MRLNRLLAKFLLLLMGVIVTVVAFSLFTAADSTTNFYYTVTDLGMPPGYSDYALISADDINEAGQVVVNLKTYSQKVTHGFVWENGRFTRLGTLGGNYSKANEINNVGKVVGSSTTSNGDTHAFIWHKGTMTDLGTSGGNYSEAYGINERGQVVGRSDSGSMSAVLWQNGKIIKLSIPPPNNVPFQVLVLASDINNQEQFVGILVPVGGELPLVASLDRFGNVTGIESLPVLDFHLGVTPPLKINKKGDIIYSVPIPGFLSTQAYLWQNGNKLTNLGCLGGLDSNSGCSQSNDINDKTIVVGSSITISGNGKRHAFVWKNAQMSDLNDLLPPNSGWELQEANGINNRGQIVGNGIYQGRSRAVLLTPTWVTN